MQKLLNILTIWLLGMGVANAALITYSYTDITSSFNSSSSLYDYITNSSNTTSSSVTDFTLVSGEEDSVSMVEFSFNLASLTDLDVFAGVDADYGAEIYVNGVQAFDTQDNLWWKLDWSNSDVFGVADDFNGFVDIKIVWAEECCGGSASIALSSSVLPSGLNELSVSNLEALEIASSGSSVSVPTPSTVFLLGLGVLLIGTRKFRV